MRVAKAQKLADPANMNKNSHKRSGRSIISEGGHSLSVDWPDDLSSRPGPVWLFIHGIALSSAFWPAMMPSAFRNEAAWISASLPVHAPSRGPVDFGPLDVKPTLFNRLYGTVIDELSQGRPVIVVGHSTGGFAGLCLALARPDAVAGVVSVGGFADGRWVGLEGDMQLMAQRRKFGPLGPVTLKATSRLTIRWPWLHVRAAAAFAHDKKAFLGDQPTREALRQHRRDARTQDDDQLIAFFSGIREVDIWDRVPRIEQPVLVVDGDKDSVIPLERTERLAARLPRGELRLYRGVGHMVMNERRDRFWSDVIAWGSAIALPAMTSAARSRAPRPAGPQRASALQFDKADVG